MERRHQVFISSTYADLQEERAEVIQALLELDCFPAGMELFPATTASAWELIKGVIDDSDYYCLIVGGRYGSLDPNGVGYTEKEYDYASSTGKPLMAFIHKDPNQIPSGKAEKSDAGKVKLETFRKKVEGAHHCKYWNNSSELGGLVSRSLVNLRKAHPSEGWVRGRFAATDALMVEVANLRARNAELIAERTSDNSNGSEAVEGIASGSDPYAPTISYIEVGKEDRARAPVKTTWDEILRYVGPALLNECSEREFSDKLKLCFYHALEREHKIKVTYESVVLPHVVADQIKIQLRALGQMIPGTKRRAVADKLTYWKLTSAGEKRLINAQAIQKSPGIESPLAGALKAFAALRTPAKGPDIQSDSVPTAE
ncbi:MULTISPECIES: DUF4062 domain-containing protein [unclassified Roseateles]|uniref:DUF4062 domain-containing protein n=1 Tax=unclassified Roseateles TaxID=2626991 RepID=UPI0009EC694B|nr:MULTISPECIES: DUF4062 domain-containing protein [unclassified Roseateles]